MKVELTPAGYLSMSAAVAEYFPTGTVAVLPRDDELWVMPVSYPGAGGLLLKVQNSRGDRCVLVDQFLPPGVAPGTLEAVWDDDMGALRVSLRSADEEPGEALWKGHGKAG